MKKLYMLLLIMCQFGCNNKPADVNYHSIVKVDDNFEESQDSTAHFYIPNKYDFGKVSQSKNPVLHIDFEFRNTGKYPLVINKVDVSCGCLSVNYPKEPIVAGQQSKLSVQINTKGQEGIFNKKIFIRTNADNDVEYIKITGEIKK